MVLHESGARAGCRSSPQTTGDASARRAHNRQGPRALRSIVPALELDTVLQNLPDPRQLKTSSTIILNRPFDGNFKPQAYDKHLCLTDKFGPTIPAMLSDRCREAVEERVRRLKLHEETQRRHTKPYNRLRIQGSCSTYAEARRYAKDLFADTHIVRDEGSLVPPVVEYSYSRIDASMVDGKRPAVYDYDDAQIRPRTAGFSPGHVRSLSPCPPPLCVDASTFPFFLDSNPPQDHTQQGHHASQDHAAQGHHQGAEGLQGPQGHGITHPTLPQVKPQPRRAEGAGAAGGQEKEGRGGLRGGQEGGGLRGGEDGPMQARSPQAIAAAARLQPRPSTAPERVFSSPSTSSRASRAVASVASSHTRFDTTTRRQAYARLHTHTLLERQWLRVYSAEEKLQRDKQTQLLQETMQSLHEFEKRHLQGFAGKQGLGVIYS